MCVGTERPVLDSTGVDIDVVGVNGVGRVGTEVELGEGDADADAEVAFALSSCNGRDGAGKTAVGVGDGEVTDVAGRGFAGALLSGKGLGSWPSVFSARDSQTDLAVGEMSAVSRNKK